MQIFKLLRLPKLILALSIAMVMLPSSGPAQTVVDESAPTEPFQIFAVLWRGETEVEAGFRDYFNQRGIPYEMTVRNLNLDRGNAPPIVEEIKRVRPDLVYTWGTGTTRSIVGAVETEEPEKFIRDIPGIFVLVAYPKIANIIESFEQTGRPVTGVSFLASIEAQLNTILAYRPFKKMAVIYDKTASNSRINVASLEDTVPKFGMELLILPVPLDENGKSDPETLPELIQQAKDDGADILYVGPDSFLTRHGDVYTASAIAAGLPTFASTQAPLKNFRAMFGLVTDYHTLGKLAAVQAERILLEKKRPEDLPIAQLKRFKLWINIDVVREVGLYPPMGMITIADFKDSRRNN